MDAASTREYLMGMIISSLMQLMPRLQLFLCIGGVAKYHVLDPACTCDWITTHVTPQIFEVFCGPVTYLLEKALLWLANSTEQLRMPDDLHTRIQKQYVLV